MSHAYDLIVYGSINMDLVHFVDHLPLQGETVTSRSYHEWPGGKAANQAVGAAKLGANIKMVGRVGEDDMGQALIENFVLNEVNCSNVYRTSDNRTGTATISVDNVGQNSIITNVGANYCLTKTDVEQSIPDLTKSNIVLLQVEMPKHVAEYIIAKAVENNKKVVLNLAPVNLISNEYLTMVDILIVNEVELSQISNRTINNLEDVIEAMSDLIEIGMKTIITTMGENGAFLKTKSISKHFPCPSVDAIDTTAAGDCFVASTAWFLSRGKSIEESIKRAVEVAALSTTKKGSQQSLPTINEYHRYKQNLI